MRKMLSAVITAAFVLIVLGSTPAQALQTGNGFTADNLPTWQTNGTVWAMTAAQGKVFAGGTFNAVRPPDKPEGDPSSITRTNLAVLDAATGTPTSCVLNITRGSTQASVRTLAASPDGSVVYVGGLFTTINAVDRQNIAAIEVSTCTVLPFNPRPSSFVYAITATANAVYFGGNFASVGGVTRSDLGAATPAGALLPWAPTADDDIFGLAVDPTRGNVVIVGRMNLVNNQDSHAIVVVDGTTGTTNVRNYPQPFIPWSPGTGQRNGAAALKTITSDSTGFYVGAEGTGPGIFDGRAAFDWSTYNQRWRDTCLGATQALAVYKGVLFAGNHSHDCETENTFEDGARHYFTSETTADKKYLPWWPQGNDGIGEGIGPRSITVAPASSGDYLWYGGEFTSINGKAQRGLTRFGQAPDTSAPDAPSTPNVTSTSSGQATVTWRTTQDADDKTLTYYLYRDASTSPIATLRADSEFYYHPQLTYTDTGLTPGSTHTYRVRASDGTSTTDYSDARSVKVASAAGTYPNRIVADGASIYFRMEEPSGSPAANAGSAATAGTYLNASARVGRAGALLGQSDTSALFDGTSSSLRTDVRQNAPSTYSVELWFKTTTTRGGRLIGFGNKALINGGSPYGGLSGASDRQVYMSDDGTVTFGTRTAGGTVSTLKTSKAYNDGDWHQVVATQGSGGSALYLDGNRFARSTVTTALPGTGYWRVGGDAIGSSFPALPTSNFIAANLDEAAVYPTALTPVQIEAHYRLSGRTLVPVRPADAYGSRVFDDDPSFYWRLGEATGTTAQDSVQNGNTGTYSGSGVTRGVAGAITGTSDTAVTLDGTAGSVSSAKASAGPNVYSEEAWFKTTTTTGGKILGFGNSQTGSSTAYDRHLYLGNDGKLRFGVYVAGYSVLTSPTALNNGAWHHVVGVQDGGGQKLYVDGVVVASNAVSGNETIATGYWRVGGDSISGWPGSPTSKFLKGSVDEVAVYLKALTPGQVAAHRNATVSTPVRKTVTLDASEDTMVTQAAPSTTYGSSATLASRGGSSAYTGYLKFEVPAAPAGSRLVGATLKLRTSSDDFAGSADTHSVTSAPTGWSESSLSWSNRPTLGSEVGTVAKGTGKSQDLTVALDTSAIGGAGTGTLGLGLTSTSTDNLWVWSTNSQVASYRPALVLEYEVA